MHSGNITSGMSFSEFPQKPFEIRLMRINYLAKGPWIIQWQPSAAPAPDPNTPTLTVTPTQLPLPTQTTVVSDSIISEVRQLGQKFDSSFLDNPGWVHIVRETISNPKSGQAFPPPYLKSEDWFEIDAEGYVLRNVHLDYDKTGQIIQQAATVGNYSVNFTTGVSSLKNDTHYQFSLDKLTGELSRATKYENSQITREEITCNNGRPCLLISGWENFSSPMQNPGETQAFFGAGRHVWIDLETGQQVQYQSFWLLEDGSERINSTSSYILTDKVCSPSQEVLDLLARVIAP